MKSGVFYNKKGVMILGISVLIGLMLVGAAATMQIMEKTIDGGGSYYDEVEKKQYKTNEVFIELGKEAVWTHFGNDDIRHEPLWKLLDEKNREAYAEEGQKRGDIPPLRKLFDSEKNKKKMSKFLNDYLLKQAKTDSNMQKNFEAFMKDLMGPDFKFADISKVNGLEYDPDPEHDALTLKFKDGNVILEKGDLVEAKEVNVGDDGIVEVTFNNGGTVKMMPGGDPIEKVEEVEGKMKVTFKSKDVYSVGEGDSVKQIKGGYEYKGKTAKVTRSDGRILEPAKGKMGTYVVDGRKETFTNTIASGKGLFETEIGKKAFSVYNAETLADFSAHKQDPNTIAIMKMGDDYLTKIKADGFSNLNAKGEPIFSENSNRVAGKVDGSNVKLQFSENTEFAVIAKGDGVTPMGYSGIVEANKPVLVGDLVKTGSEGKISSSFLKPFTLTHDPSDTDVPRDGCPDGGCPGGGGGGEEEQGGAGAPPGGGGGGSGGGGEKSAERTPDQGNPDGCQVSEGGYINCPREYKTGEEDCSLCPDNVGSDGSVDASGFNIGDVLAGL